MKTLKKLIVPAVCLASLTAGFAYADGFLLGAPGVPVGSVVESSAPFKTTKNLGRFYKYVFRGIETKGAGNGQNGNSNNNNGHLNVFASVNGDTVKEVGNSFKDQEDYNTSGIRTVQVTPIEYKQILDVIVEWKATGSIKSPNGYFIILGEGIREPKEPKGTLGVQAYALEGDKFKIKWDVLRDY